MNEQLSFGVERDILVDELQFYFEQDQSAEFEDEEINVLDPRKKANEMLRLLEKAWQEACAHVVPDASVREVYTIENLTSFYRFQKDDSLIVYLGGYHNSVRRQLLLDIYHALPVAEYMLAKGIKLEQECLFCC